MIPCLFQLPEATGILWLMESFLFLHLQNQHPCISLTVLPQSHLFLTKAEKFSSVQSLSRVQLFATLRTPACQASLSITNPQSLLKFMCIELVMPSNHLSLCRPLLIPPSIFPRIRVFSNESVLPSGGQSIGISASASVFPMNIRTDFL